VWNGWKRHTFQASDYGERTEMRQAGKGSGAVKVEFILEKSLPEEQTTGQSGNFGFRLQSQAIAVLKQ